MKSITLCFLLFYCGAVFSKACELNNKPVEETEYSLPNPFTVCIDDINIPGLPEIRKPAWKAKIKGGKILGKITQVVCESLYDTVKDEFKDAFKDIIKGATGKADQIGIKDVQKYCKKHPDFCLAGDKTSSNSSSGQSAYAQGITTKPTTSSTDTLSNSSVSTPSWGGWGTNKNSLNSQQVTQQKAVDCNQKPWLCPKPSQSGQNKIDSDEKYKVTKKRY